MASQGSHGNRRAHGRIEAVGLDSWKTIRRALKKMAATSRARVVLDTLARTVCDLADADLAQVDLFVPASEHFILGGLAGRDGEPSPLCSHPHQNALACVVLKQGRPLDQALDTEAYGFAEHVRHVLVYPMLGNSLRGVIMIGYQHALTKSVSEMTQWLGMLTDQASLMLYQLGQRRERLKKNAHLALLDAVSRLAIESSDRASALDQILTEIGRTFKLWDVLLYTGEPAALHRTHRGTQTHIGVRLTEGLARQAWDAGQPVMSNQVERDERCAIPTWVAADIRSEAAVPLVYQGVTRGVLDCLSLEGRAFDPADLQTLRTVARQISPLLWTSVRVDSDCGSDVGTASSLRTAIPSEGDENVHEGRSLSVADVSLDEMVADPVLDAALRVLDADGAALYLVHTRRLVPDAYRANRRRFDWTSFDGLTLAQEAMRRNETLVAGSVTGVPWPPSTYEWQDPGGGVVVPVSWQGTLYAVLLVAYRGDTDFPRIRARALRDLARLAALALALAARSRNGVQQARQWRFLYEIALKTQRLSSPMDVILEAADRLCETMEWQATEVYRWDEASDGFVRLGDAASQPFVMPEPHGIVGEAARRRDAVVRDSLNAQGGEMAVPLMDGDQLQGVFYVRGRPDQRFGEDDRRFLSDVATMMTDTLADIALYGRLRHQLKETRTLYDITRQVDYKASLDEVLPQMLGVIQRVIESQRAMIALVDDAGESLRVTWASDLDAANRDEPVTIPMEGVLGRVATTGKPAYVADRRKRGVIAVPLGAEDARSLLAVPLVSSQGETIGTLSVSSREPGAFTRAEEQILTVAAGQIAMVVENMKLYQGLARRGKRLKAAYEQLQEFAKLKDQILQNISHELRTPLTLIKGHVELVLGDTDGRLTPAQRRGLELAVVKSDEVVNIVEKIVSLSPLSSFALKYTSIQVAPLLESMAQMISQRVRDRTTRIRVEQVKPDLCIYGDFDKIKQVCYNILDNSIKFSPHGGDILISADSEDAYVHLQFRDHGVGIPKERIPRIFDTFYQVDGSSTRRFGGLGLGLTVVHRIVEAHDGKIWVESEVDRGSVFHVLLPRDLGDSRHQWGIGNE